VSNRGFGPGFSKDVEAILACLYAQPPLITENEARMNLHKAGMILFDDKLPLPESFTPPEINEDDLED
jgi:hypothetical protein